LKEEFRLNNIYLKTSFLHHTNLSHHYKKGQVNDIYRLLSECIIYVAQNAGRLDVKATDVCNLQLALSR